MVLYMFPVLMNIYIYIYLYIYIYIYIYTVSHTHTHTHTHIYIYISRFQPTCLWGIEISGNNSLCRILILIDFIVDGSAEWPLEVISLPRCRTFRLVQ